MKNIEKIAVVTDSYHSYKNFMRCIKKENYNEYFYANTLEKCKGREIKKFITYANWHLKPENFEIIEDLKTRIRIK